MRFGLFAKPYVPLSERFAFFGRVFGGLALHLSFYPTAIEYYSEYINTDAFQDVYKGQFYGGLPFGAFGAGMIGFEIFFTSRLGIAAEWGIRTSLFHGYRNMPQVKTIKPQPGAPNSFNFMNYEFPIMLTLHMIL